MRTVTFIFLTVICTVYGITEIKMPAYQNVPRLDLPSIDYNDDIYNRDILANLNAQKIIFTHQQTRKNERPTIDHREENIGRYLYMPRWTSTTLEPETMSPVMHDSYMPAVNSKQNYDWNNYYSAMPSTDTPVAALSPPTTTTEAEATWDVSPNAEPMTSFKSSVESQRRNSYDWPHRSISALGPRKNLPYLPRTPRRTPTSRGSHKFNWSDVEQAKFHTEPAVTTNAPSRGPGSGFPPPSVPTLSPWVGDNFGK